MSELKAVLFKHYNNHSSIIYSFPLFKESHNYIDDEDVSIIIDKLNKIIKLEFITFYSHIINNNSFTLFINAYLNNRKNPVPCGKIGSNFNHDNITINNGYVIDELIFIIYNRIISIEYKDKLKTIFLLNKIGEDNSIKNEIQYLSLVTSSSLLNLSNIIKLISIVGDSNSKSYIQFINNLWKLNSNSLISKELFLQSELITMIKDNISLLYNLTSDENFISSIFTPYIKDNFDVKKITKKSAVHLSTKKVTTSSIPSISSIKSKTKNPLEIRKYEEIKVENNLIAVYDFSVFLLNNIYALSCLLSGYSDVFVNSNILSKNDGFLSNLGSDLINILKYVYEVYIISMDRFHASIQDNVVLKKEIDKLNSNILFIKKRLIKCMGVVLDISKRQFESNLSIIMNNECNELKNTFNWIDLFPLLLDDPFLINNNLNCINIKTMNEDIINSTINIVIPGSFISDIVKVYHNKIKDLINSLQDKDSTEYLLLSLSAPVGTLQIKEKYVDISLNNQNSITSPNINNNNVENQVEEKEVLDTLKSVFPDYGEAFLLACYNSFDNSIERTIDALLNDNLPIALLNMDRKISKIWIGPGGRKGGSSEDKLIDNSKQGNFTISSSIKDIKNNKDEKYRYEIDEKFKSTQLTLMRMQQRQEQEDEILIEKEYNDDYDDQYDSNIVGINTGGENNDKVNKITISKQNKNSKISSINWEIKMKETSRLNKLMRDDEEEDKYWASMRNDNYDKDFDKVLDNRNNNTDKNNNIKDLDYNEEEEGETKEEEENDDDDESSNNKMKSGYKKSNEAVKKQSNSNPNPNARRNTGKFDKHRQKDKVLKKGANFYL